MKIVKEIIDAIRKTTYQHRELCALVTLDIKNAFNSASWKGIIEALIWINIGPYLIYIIQSYLDNRKLSNGNYKSLDITAGVPQWSVLSPTLWNVFFDKIMNIILQDEVTMLAYADELAIVAKRKNVELLKMQLTNTIEDIQECLRNMKLELATKSEMVILTGEYRFKTINSSEGRTANK